MILLQEQKPVQNLQENIPLVIYQYLIVAAVWVESLEIISFLAEIHAIASC
jgi:hypothetical protein